MYIDHVALFTNDLEKMVNFYVKYFGCKVGERYDNPTKQLSLYYLSFDSGSRLEIMTRANVTDRFPVESLGLTHICIKVGDKNAVDELTRRMEADGIKVQGYPRTTGDGAYESVILDPDGNHVELQAL